MIEITKDLAIMADSNCYISGKPYQNKKGQTVLRNPKYYSTMAQAVSGALATLMREEVENDTITTLQDFIKRKEELQKQFATMIEPLE